jgi:hypothetical protein
MVNPRRFPDSELVERNPKLDIDALYRTGSLFMGQISRWACHWLTVTIRAEWERIWIDDQEVAIVRDRFLNGRYVRITARPAPAAAAYTTRGAVHSFAGPAPGTTTAQGTKIAGRPP